MKVKNIEKKVSHFNLKSNSCEVQVEVKSQVLRYIVSQYEYKSCLPLCLLKQYDCGSSGDFLFDNLVMEYLYRQLHHTLLLI